MTGEEAVHVLQREKDYVQQSIQNAVDGNGYVSPDGLIRAEDYVKACTVAISALRAQKEQESNDPLTLDELREMDGKPVWIVEDPDWGHWELSVCAEDYVLERETDFYGMKYDDPDGRYGLHKLGWLAYRRKPEEGTV